MIAAYPLALLALLMLALLDFAARRRRSDRGVCF
jgi:hypothetical protein